jgi:REP element-mobilizing transposase RayT
MKPSLLIVTPHASFGELIRKSLLDVGEYHIHIVDSQEDALTWLRTNECAFAFLDTDLRFSILTLGLELRKIKSKLGLVIVSGAGVPPALDELRPWALLRKPFYQPDLINLLETGIPRPNGEQAAGSVRSAAQPDENEPIWLKDVSRAAQHLTRLTLESSAQAALITRKGELWAYAGQLSQAAAQELSASLTRGGWMGESDLLRFIRLKATSAEHMLYATNLAEGLILALVFDAETPFSTIRTQANSLAHSLFATKYETGPYPLKTDYGTQNDESDAEDLPPISEILSDVPPPNPVAGKTSERIVKEPAPTPPIRPVVTPLTRHEPSPAIPLPAMMKSDQNIRPKDHPAGTPQVDTDLEETRLSSSSLAETRASHIDLGETTRSDAADKDFLDNPITDQSPKSVTEVVGRRIVVEPASPAMYNLTYACLLVPRFSTHFLTGDLATKLSDWVQDICISYGWRLEFQAVRPEYLQWVVNVPPATSPGYLMRIIRQQTSEKILNDFPRLKRENPSGDFWAPGYLIMGGGQPHPPQLVRDYIRQTRQRQGVTGKLA